MEAETYARTPAQIIRSFVNNLILAEIDRLVDSKLLDFAARDGDELIHAPQL
jgi:hypothetical protein